MTVYENSCKIEVSPDTISCAYDHPVRRKKYAWKLIMKDDQLTYSKLGKSRRVYDVKSIEEILFEVVPVSNTSKAVKGHKAIAHVKVRGEFGAVKLCHLMAQGTQAEANETEAYYAMDKVVKALSDKYGIPASYADSIFTKDKLNKLIKGVIIVSGVILAFIVMALLTE